MPRHSVSSLLQRVTQWMSTVTSSVGSAVSSVHDQVCSSPDSARTVNAHRSSGTWGVGPADSTGKSSVRYCPGGSRPSSSLRRPWNPRVNRLMLDPPWEPIVLRTWRFGQGLSASGDVELAQPLGDLPRRPVARAQPHQYAGSQRDAAAVLEGDGAGAGQ